MSIGSDLKEAADLLAKAKMQEASGLGAIKAALASPPVFCTWVVTLAVALAIGLCL